MKSMLDRAMEAGLTEDQAQRLSILISEERFFQCSITISSMDRLS